MASKLFLCCSLISFSLLIMSFNSNKCEAQMVPAVFVFGDSLVDVGNNNHLPVSFAKANFPHNGVDFPTKKPTGRFNNGKNTADFLAEKVGLPTSAPYLSVLLNLGNSSTFMTGLSFASGGAGIFNSTDQVLGQALPLTKQVGAYQMVVGKMVEEKGTNAAKTHLAKSLFAVVIGSNDLFDYSSKKELQTQTTPQQFVDMMLATLKPLLKKIYDHGARKFVFAGIGPVGCIPAQRVNNATQGCNEAINSMAFSYNKGLVAMLDGLKSELLGFSYSYLDTYSLFNNITANPASYGFTEVKSACCGLGTLRAKVPCLPIAEYCSNRREHTFWDLFHPTQAVAGILVDALFNGPPPNTYPINVRQLVIS